MPTSPLRCLLFTDTHIFADGDRLLAKMNTRASFLAVRDAALREQVATDLILLTGDLAADAESGAYTWLIEALAAFDAPVYCIAGNHDTVALMEPQVTAEGWFFGGNHGLPGWRLILLDSTVSGEAYGQLSDAETARLSAALGADKQTPTMIALHHHPLPTMSRWMDTMLLRNAGQFWSIVEQHPQVQAVVWGHVHQNYDSYRDSVRTLATPSTCVQFAARANDFALDALAPGYRRMELFASGHIETVVRRVALP